MTYMLRLPADFDEYAWEVEAKGVYWDAVVEGDGRDERVTFYDLTRLCQDAEQALSVGPTLSVRNLLVVERVTVDRMKDAVAALADGFMDL